MLSYLPTGPTGRYYQRFGALGFFLSENFSFVVQLSFVPVCVVEKVWLTSSRTSRNVRCF